MSKEKEEMKPLTEKDKNFALYLDLLKLKPTTCMNIYLQHNKIVKRALQEERMKWQSAIALLKKSMCLNQAREKGCPDYMQCSNCKKISECFQIQWQGNAKVREDKELVSSEIVRANSKDLTFSQDSPAQQNQEGK